VINKANLAVVAALVMTGAASPAFARTHHHHYPVRRVYNSARSVDNNTNNMAATPSPTYDPAAVGGGSLGFNEHDEVKN
jgi:hypothetical protein